MTFSNPKSLKNQTSIGEGFGSPTLAGEAFTFQTLIEHIQVAILIFQDDKICYANSTLETLTEYSLDELLASTDWRSQLQLEQKSQRLKQEGAIPNQEVKLLTKSDRECWLDCSFKPIQFAQKPAISITAVNITKYKQAQQKIQQVLEQKKKLISMVSHELRTPLNVISFSANLLKTYGDRWKPAKVKNYLEKVQRGVDTLSLLIDEWLILGKIDGGKLKLEPQVLNLEEFCRNLLSDLQLDSSNPRQINFFYQGDNSSVILDRRIIQLILTNLLENAIKYSPEGKAIDFTVTCNFQEVTFKVKDRGIGITPGDRLQLFKPFYRGNNVDNIPGHGLGLAIVNKLVELSGGQINVASQLGIETEFTVSIPQPI